MESRNKSATLPSNAALDILGTDLLIRCASYLDAHGLVQLGRTSARYGIPQAGLKRSLANEAARQRFRQSVTDKEKGCLPKCNDESDIGLYRALELMRQPLGFDELVGGGFSPQEHPSRFAYTGRCGVWSTALSGHVMRGGKHFVEFAITHERNFPHIMLGVIRPVSLTKGINLEADWEGMVHPVMVSSSFKPAVSERLRSQRTAKWGGSNVHCCAYHSNSGRCCWTDWENEWGLGQERLPGGRGTMGLLLNLDEGTLSVSENGGRLGMIKGGLNGQYCWFVSVYSSCTISMSKSRAPN
ncbi:hypothetical protein THAOC_36211 [Thalassiosira oceanica]|uniref:Uncharacterized protein n=1 Tax=Thalassiosira oceanica TaxID=159749 RepID=K0RFA8_THAOC|nr:hypothetical protein THAOC_36211 [Thalassiosira oceanica]|eukprot:EJK45187.1 hypothetical protein THAOC_36211 [Thalassiosira oceanica]